MGAARTLRRMARRAVPIELRQALAHSRRMRSDRSAGTRFAATRGGEGWPEWIELSQPVMPSSLLQAKLRNLERGAALLDLSLIEPDGEWSFWHRIGRPSARNGFVPGRNLVEGRLVRQVGGGLCQLSGLVHHLALLGGLRVTERHAHSVDIYREDERHTPLGADATVVWGFKDLRLRNPHPFAVSIRCGVMDGRLVGRLCGDGPIRAREVAFVRDAVPAPRVRVWTVVDGATLCETEYERRPGLAPV